MSAPDGRSDRADACAPSPRPLSILLLYDCIYPGSVGGVEHRNYELARALAVRGHEVTLAGFTVPTAPPAMGMTILPLGPRGQLYTEGGKRSTGQALRFAAKVASLDLSPYDLVETANIPYVHLFPLALRCRLAGKPLLVTWYEYWGPYWREYFGPLRALPYRAIERLAVPLGRRAIADSRLAAERVEARRGEAVPVVPVGIPIEAIRAAAASPAEPDAPPAAPLLYAGRLLKEKRVDLLVEALARVDRKALPSQGPWLSILGTGPERERLERQVGEVGLTDRVVFRGHLPTSADVWRELGRAKIAVQPSSREGFGLFPLEAMAAGLPVVYCESPESALPELVRDGGEGISTAPEPEPLASAISRLLTDEGERERLSRAARERSEAYSWAAIARRMENLFLDLA